MPADAVHQARPALRWGRTPPVGFAGLAIRTGDAWEDGAVRELRVPIRVRPGASHPRVGGAYNGPRGRALVVAVAAPAVDGRATEAALRALAEALGVPRRAVTLVAGAASRDKLVAVAGPGEGTAERLAALLGPG